MYVLSYILSLLLTFMLTLKPGVGTVLITWPCLILYKIVVFPALSRPRIMIFAGWGPKIQSSRLFTNPILDIKNHESIVFLKTVSQFWKTSHMWDTINIKRFKDKKFSNINGGDSLHRTSKKIIASFVSIPLGTVHLGDMETYVKKRIYILKKKYIEKKLHFYSHFFKSIPIKSVLI